MSMQVRFGTQTCECRLMRTTTQESKKIMEAENTLEAYVEAVRNSQLFDSDKIAYENNVRNYAADYLSAYWYLA